MLTETTPALCELCEKTQRQNKKTKIENVMVEVDYGQTMKRCFETRRSECKYNVTKYNELEF